MWTKCSRAPVSRAASSAARTASISVTGGRERAQSSAVWRPSARACWPRRCVRTASSACSASSSRGRMSALRCMASSSANSSRCGNSASPLSHRKALTPTTPARLQLGEVLERLGHQAAPQRVVHQRVLGDRAAFDGQRAGVERRRMAVERHVAHGGDAAGRGRGRAGEKAFPVGAAGLVEVDVRVDEAGQDVQAAGVDAPRRRCGSGRAAGWRGRVRPRAAGRPRARTARRRAGRRARAVVLTRREPLVRR